MNREKIENWIRHKGLRDTHFVANGKFKYLEELLIDFAEHLLSELSKESEGEKQEIILSEHQQELLNNMSAETIKYFGALMIAFGIPNYFEAEAKDDHYQYKFRIDKKKLETPPIEKQ